MAPRWATPGDNGNASASISLREDRSARQRRVDPEVAPELMERKHITKAAAWLLDDLRGGVLGPTDRPIESADQRIQPLWRDLVKAPEVGHNARAHLAGVVSKRLDQLQILAPSGLCDARIHYVATLSPFSPVINIS